MNELTRWDPFKSPIPFGETVFDMVPALLRPLSGMERRFTGPRMDVLENENAYQLAIELPGVPKDAIQVGVHENTVTIAAELTSQEKGEQAEERIWLLRERNFGKLARNITLPEAVDEESSEARYTDGVLYLTLRKKRASQVKRISVH